MKIKKQKNGMVNYFDEKYRFIEFWNPTNGFYARTNILDENGKETDKEAFMRSFPALIDVGIMGHCVHGKSGLCRAAGIECYQNGLTRTKENMSLENYKKIIKEGKEKGLQQCLKEDELVLVKRNDFIYSITMKDLSVGDLIYDGNDFVKVVNIKKRLNKDIYKIQTNYGKTIFATDTHRFPTNSGLKYVSELKKGDCLKMMNNEIKSKEITELNLIELIILNNQENNFSVFGDGITESLKKHNIKKNSFGSVRVNKVMDFYKEFDYSKTFISIERSQYSLPSVLPITSELMKLLGHYIGNGSKRTYVQSIKQIKFISEIKHCLNSVFPDYKYIERIKNNTNIIELDSQNINEKLFDKILNCRDKNKQKQLPNFIFNLNTKFKNAFLSGYICDATLTISNNKDGNYGSLVFNSSSPKLAKDLMILLHTMNINPSISTEKAHISFYKKENRYIHHKRRFKISIRNKIDLQKLDKCWKDHYLSNEFTKAVSINNENYSHMFKNPLEIILIEKINKETNVVDIEVDSTEHLFVTSNGFISHNCALGGCGDVDQHENFEEILKYTKDSGIIPNFTTSGLGLTKEKAHICKKYCGAVAVSQYSRLISYEVRRKVQNSDELTENLVFYIGKEDNSTYTTNYFDGYIIINNKQWEVVDTTENKNSEYQYATVYEDINGNQKNENNRKYTVDAITNLLEEGVITNIHYVLGNNSIDEAITRLKYNLFPKGINAVIFLLHKPVGLGTKENVLDVDSPKLKEFFELVDKNQFDFKIGFDSCSIPGIINMTKNISKASIDTCEGSRFSCYIDAQMNMMPCSFDNEQLRWAESLNDKTIEEVWNGKKFESFRDSLKNSCMSCKNRNICMGGCPIVPEIVLCNSKDKLLLNEVGPSVFKTIK